MCGGGCPVMVEININRSLAFWTKCLAIFTGLLFAITVVIAILSYRQILDSKHALVMNARAFVYATPLGARIGVLDGDNNFKIIRQVISMHNSGNTQTSHLIILFRCHTNPTTPEEPFVLLYKGDVNPMPQLIGPKANISVNCDFTFDQMTAIQNQKLHGFVIGQMLYNDVIEKETRHRTDYCAEFMDVTLNASADPPTFFSTLEAAGRHNCADDDCPKETVLN
jgi:hypothetical protein